MADDDLDTPQPAPVDPATAVIESIQFGDAGEAAEKLRGFLDGALTEAEHRRAIATETERSRAALERFCARNSHLADDEMASAAIEKRMYGLQREDLKAAGLDLEKWKEQSGRDPTPAEIANSHRFYRAAGNKAVRSCEDLLDRAAADYYDWSGRRRSGNIDEDRARAVRDRANASRLRRGLPELAVDPDTGAVLRDRVADMHTPAEETLRQMGGDEQRPDQDQARSNAVEKMRLERRLLRGPGSHLLANERLGGERVGSRTGLIEAGPARARQTQE